MYQRVAAAPLFASATPPVPVAKYKKPEWNPKQHQSIQVLVCCAEDYAEQARQEESFEKGAVLVYRVWVGLIHDERFDDATLRWFLDAREAVRLAAWDLTLCDDEAGTFDVDYDPSGAGAKKSNAPNVDESWMRFDFAANLPRTGPTGR